MGCPALSRGVRWACGLRAGGGGADTKWGADMVAVFEPDGDPIECVRYSAHGVPFVDSAGDVNLGTQTGIFDLFRWDDFTGYGTGDMAVDADVNRDGAVEMDMLLRQFTRYRWSDRTSQGPCTPHYAD